MKDHIVEEVKIAKETGKITSKKIHEIVRKAVADAVSEGKGGAEEIRPIVKDAMSAAVEGLKAAGQYGGRSSKYKLFTQYVGSMG